MANLEAKCPSGLQVTVRGLKGKELDTYANKQSARRGNVFLQLCASCTVKVHDAGPYDLQADGTLRWGDVLVGDLTYLACAIRNATFFGTPDESFVFRVRCPNEDCDGRPNYHTPYSFEWELDLLDLHVKSWSSAETEAYKAKTSKVYSFDVDLVGYTDGPVADGRYRIEHKLITGRDQKNADANVDPDRRASHALKRRIAKLHRVDGDEVTPITDMVDWIADLDVPDIDMIVSKMDENDCGVETAETITCPQCEEEWDEEVPLDRLWKRRKGSARFSRSQTSRRSAASSSISDGNDTEDPGQT